MPNWFLVDFSSSECALNGGVVSFCPAWLALISVFMSCVSCRCSFLVVIFVSPEESVPVHNPVMRYSECSAIWAEGVYPLKVQACPPRDWPVTRSKVSGKGGEKLKGINLEFGNKPKGPKKWGLHREYILGCVRKIGCYCITFIFIVHLNSERAVLKYNVITY